MSPSRFRIGPAALGLCLLARAVPAFSAPPGDEVSWIRRLAHHRSRPFNSYVCQPRASASRSGERIVYSGNYGLQDILGHPLEYSDVYMIMRPGPIRRGWRASPPVRRP